MLRMMNDKLTPEEMATLSTSKKRSTAERGGCENERINEIGSKR